MDENAVRLALSTKALRRSTIRRAVVEYLFDISPSYSYASEISRHIGCPVTNVVGAIRGMNNRYRKEEGLLNLNIVAELRYGTNHKLFCLTPWGEIVFKAIR